MNTEYPTLDRAASRELDKRAIEQFGMTGLVLMENAGRGLADFLCRTEIAATVLICCGKGNNAGDGFVLARHLELRGKSARVLLWAKSDELTGDARANYEILTKTDVPIIADNPSLQEHIDGAAWIVDGLLGTGARGEPRPPLDIVIDQINASRLPTLAIDIPSGLDCDSGIASSKTVRADHTCTFATAKQGFLKPEAAEYVGKLHILDIGAPPKLIEQLLAEQEQ
jgi:NAD(P)H-hydrate epimerase